MRFIRKEFIETTIFNKELTDDVSIRTVFENLFSHNIDFSITIKKYLTYQCEYFNLNFEKARIKAVYDDNTLDLLTLKKGVKTVMNKVPFSEVVEVFATTKKHNIIDVDDTRTRWEILDFK